VPSKVLRLVLQSVGVWAYLSGQRRTIRVFHCPIAAMPKPYRSSFSSTFRHVPFYRRKMTPSPARACNRDRPSFATAERALGFRLGQHAHVRELKHPEAAGAERWGCCECPVCELYLAHGRPAYQDDRVLWSDSLLSWQTSSSPDKLGG
jgi:hypothetical protein